MAIGAQFAAALQALLKKLQTQQAEIDFKEQARRRLFATNEANQTEAYPAAIRATNENLADRGLVQSGIGLEQTGLVNRNHLQALSALNTGLQNDLSDYARQRLSNQSQYDYDYASLLAQDAASNANTMAQTGKGYSTTPPAVVAAVKTAQPKVVQSPTPKIPARTIAKRSKFSGRMYTS